MIYEVFHAKCDGCGGGVGRSFDMESKAEPAVAEAGWAKRYHDDRYPWWGFDLLCPACQVKSATTKGSGR